MRLDGRLVRVNDLSVHQRRRMFDLMDQHYADVDRATFEADLNEKQWAIAICDRETGGLCGFSTQMLLAAEVAGRPIRALFSGDTIIDRRYWGDQALSRVWGRFALSLVDRYPGEELYWFLISQGYKTYRFLPLFFHEFYPRAGAPTPGWAQDVIDTLGRQKFAGAYDEVAGIVRPHAKQYRLRAGVADATPARQRDRHVQFFVQRNPGHAGGDELCCVAPLTRDNFTAAAFRVMALRQSLQVS